jgi:hypothetical protein
MSGPKNTADRNLEAAKREGGAIESRRRVCRGAGSINNSSGYVAGFAYRITNVAEENACSAPNPASLSLCRSSSTSWSRRGACLCVP